MRNRRHKLSITIQLRASFRHITDWLQSFQKSHVRDQRLVRLTDGPDRRQSAINEISLDMFRRAE